MVETPNPRCFSRYYPSFHWIITILLSRLPTRGYPRRAIGKPCRESHLWCRMSGDGKNLRPNRAKSSFVNANEIKLQHLDLLVLIDTFEFRPTCGLLLPIFCFDCSRTFKTPSQVENIVHALPTTRNASSTHRRCLRPVPFASSCRKRTLVLLAILGMHENTVSMFWVMRSEEASFSPLANGSCKVTPPRLRVFREDICSFHGQGEGERSSQISDKVKTFLCSLAVQGHLSSHSITLMILSSQRVLGEVVNNIVAGVSELPSRERKVVSLQVGCRLSIDTAPVFGLVVSRPRMAHSSHNTPLPPIMFVEGMHRLIPVENGREGGGQVYS